MAIQTFLKANLGIYSLRLRLGVHKGMEWNEMKLNNHKEWNVFK